MPGQALLMTPEAAQKDRQPAIDAWLAALSR